MKNLKRCSWCEGDPIYVDYHDKEWGVLVHDDKKLFEFLILEGAQVGLSWLTILKRREGYRKAFADFNAEKVARFSQKKIEPLLNDLPTTSKESDAFSKEFKRRGFKFVGSTIIYAHMQAVGMINDHLVSCFRYKEV